MPTISSASVRLATTATDTVAPSTISTPLLLLLPVGRYWHHGRTLGGPSHPWKTSAGTSRRFRPPPRVLLLQDEEARARCVPIRTVIDGASRSATDTPIWRRLVFSKLRRPPRQPDKEGIKFKSLPELVVPAAFRGV